MPKFKIKDANLLRLSIITLLVFVLMSVLNPGKFLTLRNLESMSFQFPELGLLCLGMMLAVLTGGIDLSIVGIANLSAILAGLIMTRAFPEAIANDQTIGVILLAIAAAVGTGFICGALNGLLIARVGISPILATLGTGLMFTGIGVVVTKGSAVAGFPEKFTNLGNGTIGIIPIPLIVFAVFGLLVAFILKKKRLGVELYLVGTNMKAAIFSGMKTQMVLLRGYILTGMLGSIAGLVMISRTNSAKYDYASSYILQTVLIVVLGGVKPEGGFGRVGGVIIAVLSLQFLASGFSMLRFSMFAKDFIWGAFLLFIMVVNYLSQRRESRKLAAAA
ncbi:MAG: ABC transporter permease [Spirochaetaceae bacterium]|nr:ABC transporter permease [Spirochaetaceae bacterium]